MARPSITQLPPTGLDRFRGLLTRADDMTGGLLAAVPGIGTLAALNRSGNAAQAGNYTKAVESLTDVIPVGRLASNAIRGITRGRSAGDIGGVLNMRAPQQDALDLAQQRAALPKSQGGLGLPADNTPEQRRDALSYKVKDYIGGHQAPTSADDVGAPMYALDRVYPKDIYSSRAAQYYGDMSDPARDSALIRRQQSLKDKPDAMVNVFRAVPKKAGQFINQGDWVSMDQQYAKDHGESVFGKGNYKVISTRTPAKTLFTDANSIYEQGIDKSQKFAEGPASLPTLVSEKQPFERSPFAAFDPFRTQESDLLAFRGNMGGTTLGNINPLLGLLDDENQ